MIKAPSKTGAFLLGGSISSDAQNIGSAKSNFAELVKSLTKLKINIDKLLYNYLLYSCV